MKKHMKLILQIIATHMNLLLDTRVDVIRVQSLHPWSIEGLWMARP